MNYKEFMQNTKNSVINQFNEDSKKKDVNWHAKDHPRMKNGRFAKRSDVNRENVDEAFKNSGIQNKANNEKAIVKHEYKDIEESIEMLKKIKEEVSDKLSNQMQDIYNKKDDEDWKKLEDGVKLLVNAKVDPFPDDFDNFDGELYHQYVIDSAVEACGITKAQYESLYDKDSFDEWVESSVASKASKSTN